MFMMLCLYLLHVRCGCGEGKVILFHLWYDTHSAGALSEALTALHIRHSCALTKTERHVE